MKLQNLRPAILTLLPLIALTATLGAAGAPNEIGRWPIELMSHIRLRFPFLFGQPEAMLEFFLVAFAFVIAFVLAPVPCKKPVVIAASVAFLWYRMSLESLLTGIVATFSLFSIFRHVESPKKWIFTAIIFLAYAAVLGFIHDADGAGWRLYAQVLVGAVGVGHFLKSRPREELKPDDFFIYLCGFHGVFLTLIYGYSAITTSFLKRSYLDISKPSANEVYAGLSKILAVAAIQIFFFPTWSQATSSAASIWFINPEIGSGKLAFFLILSTFAFIFENVGFIQVAQGFSRLFGYDVKVHTNSPWLSVSFLDYWKRNGINTRDFMLTHIMMPTYLKTKSLYLSLLLVWLFWATVNAISRGVLQPDTVFHWVPHTTLLMLLLIKFVFLFANISYLEIKAQTFIAKMTSRFSKCASRGFIFIMYVLVLCIGNELLLVYFPGTDIILEFLLVNFGGR